MYWIQHSFLSHSLPILQTLHSGMETVLTQTLWEHMSIKYNIVAPSEFVHTVYSLITLCFQRVHVTCFCLYMCMCIPLISNFQQHVCMCTCVLICAVGFWTTHWNGFFFPSARPSYLTAVSLVSNSHSYQSDPNPLVSVYRSEVTCRSAANDQKSIHYSYCKHIQLPPEHHKQIHSLCLCSCSGDKQSKLMNL